MLRISIALAVAVALTGAAPAHAFPRPPLPLDTPDIVDAACPDYPEAGGCFYWDENVIYSHGLTRYGLNHELGHAYDAQVLDGAERASFGQRIHRTRWAWETSYLPDGHRDVIGLDELFADAYASCRLGWMPRGRHGGYAWTHDQAYDYEPRTNAQQRRTCAAITRWVDLPEPFAG